MEELYAEGLATRGDPESCAGDPRGRGEALTGHVQRTRVTWARMNRLAARWIPPTRIVHPFPQARFAAPHPR